MSAVAGGRPPINRKMAYLAFGGLAVVGVVALMVAGSKDPVAARKGEAEQAERKAIAAMPEGSADKGRDEVEAAAREAEKRAKDEAAARDEFHAFANGGRAGGAAAPGMPALDPELLRQLDEAQREVGRSPSLADRATDGLSGDGLPPLGGEMGSSGGGAKAGILHDNYGNGIGTVKDAVGEQMFGEGAGGGAADVAAANGADGLYEVIRPQAQPSSNVVSQGTAIHAVLMTRIDTRVAGPVTAMVRRTVYDSRTQRTPLIPQGSRLVGTYDTNVSPGVDRIAVDFQRLVLPDGRAFSLPGFPSSGADGTIGMVGKYKSNLVRAIGPAILVALAGQAVDRQIKKEIPGGDSVVQGPAGTFQTPSVLEQTMPKINEAVMQRYQGAKPYFTSEPGQSVRVVVTADIEIPTPKAGGR